MKQDCIKITAVILVPFDPDKWGDTHRAEQLAGKLMADVQAAEGVVLDKWAARKCRVEAE